MKRDQIQIGQVYRCRVGDRVTAVRVDATHPQAGWIVTEIDSGRQDQVVRPEQFRDAWRVPAAEPIETETPDEGEIDMKKNEVQIGVTYIAKVSGKLAKVRIDAEGAHGGWNGTNLETNKKVHIKGAQRLRAEAGPKRGKAAIVAGAATPTPKPERVAKVAKAPKAKAERKPAANDAKPKPVSALDAAAEVLRKSGQAMRATEMIAAMAEQGLWTSPNGKTPHSTLYAAILREIRTKAKDARFKKVEAGKFEYAG